jgi:hypothetical protein
MVPPVPSLKEDFQVARNRLNYTQLCLGSRADMDLGGRSVFGAVPDLLFFFFFFFSHVELDCRKHNFHER